MPIARPAASVTLEGFELRVLHLPLVAPFTTSFGTETVREVIVVRALTADGDGWGEIVTQDAPLYSSEYTQGAWDVATRWLIPALLGQASGARQKMSPAILHPFVGHRMAKAGLELAVLDAALRAEARPLGEYLGAERDRVPSGVSVGIQRDPAALVEAVGGYLDEGYVRIKIKIKPGRDIARHRRRPRRLRRRSPCRSTRTPPTRSPTSRRSPSSTASTSSSSSSRCRRTTSSTTRPSPGASRRRCASTSPIVSLKAATDALALGAASVINIKAGRVGGYLEAVAIHDLCRDAAHPGVVRRHARDRHRPRRQRRARRAAGLHAARAMCRHRAGSTTATS